MSSGERIHPDERRATFADVGNEKVHAERATPLHAKLTFLGTGTSMGVPTLGCGCVVCRSEERRNRRTRASVAVEYGGHLVLIDTGPDFREQAMRERVERVDAVLYTHGHADHILGFDDLRPLTFLGSGPVPLYADEPTSVILERVFEYTFRKVDRYPTSARVELHRLSSDPGTVVDLFGARFERVPVRHGRTTITGFRFGSAAYLTDMSDLSEASLAQLHGLDVVVLDALRREPHPTHSHLENSIRLAKEIGAKRTYFTHISHGLDHLPTEDELPEGVHLAYDGLQLEFRIA